MLNLLSLQGELVEMNAHFRRIWKDDDNSPDPDVNEYSSYLQKLRASKDKDNDHQYQILLKVRQKLGEYSMAESSTLPKQPQ